MSLKELKNIRSVKDPDATASIAFICEALTKLDRSFSRVNTRMRRFQAQLDQLQAHAKD
ncbi:MAG: hypothetical protein ABGX83_06970 [Nitrospira sp.]